MKLWLLTSEIMPDVFIKAESKEEAIQIFEEGWACTEEVTNLMGEIHVQELTEQKELLMSHPTFKVEELSFKEFLEIVPNEFSVTDDTSF